MEQNTSTQQTTEVQQPNQQDPPPKQFKPGGSKKKLMIGASFLVLLLIIAGVGFVLGLNKPTNKDQPDYGKNETVSSSDNPWLSDCSADKRASMTHQPMDMSDVASVTPIGATAGAHVTPIDHLYFYPNDMKNRDAAPVYAMADGFIVHISKREVNVDSGSSRPAEYRIAIQHSCQTVSYFDLLTSLDQAVLDEVPDIKTKSNINNIHIPVKAGQEIGRVGAQSLDTAIYNFSMTLPGFISPEKYKGEFWKVHTDDFFSYFNESDKTAMLAKSIRKAEPLSGKIDYDQPGKLIGNWFKEGTDYSGDGSQSVSQDGKTGYWSGHLALLYFVADPTQIIISIGQYGDGSPQAFAVKGNAPDPATVGKDSGVVAYELTQAPQFTPTGISPASSQVVGTVLFQVLDGEKLKVETFPNKTKAQAMAFTNAAITYER